MTRHQPTAPPPAPGLAHGWPHALAAVLAGYAVMVVVAALGLWLAGASELPQGAFLPVIAATVVMAVGGRVGVEGGAGTIARSDAAVTVFPLSVALAGALVTAYVVVRPLRRHAVLPGRRMVWLFVRTGVLWALATLLLALGARHTFTISTGEEILGDLSDLLGVTPTVGFRADVPVTVVAGLLWLAVVLVLAFAVSRRAPLPARLVPAHALVRPAARAMVGVLLAYVAVGAVIAVAGAFTRAEPADSFAVVFLGLPNVAWLALGLGMGASWHGSVQGALGVPMPEPLAAVLRGGDGDGDVTLDLGSLSAYDGRAWWLVAAAAVVMLAAGWATARRAAPGTGHVGNAVHLGVASAVAMLLIGVLTRIDAHYGLSLFGIGDPSDTGGLGGSVVLLPNLLPAVGIAALWGVAAGLLGSMAARILARGRPVRPGAPAR
ncbi:streptophobe family protein [Streptomyces sp. ME01-24h]|nr:streptophobe family protein [Streptomyces sp. ME19-03-3]MDX3356772.1 streptophobe family protein [Streptomyces sp. ME01-24h]